MAKLNYNTGEKALKKKKSLFNLIHTLLIPCTAEAWTNILRKKKIQWKILRRM